MRLIAMAIAVAVALGTMAVSWAANADDIPKRSEELQVLDQFVGAWDLKATIKASGQEEITQESVETRNWSVGGNFVRFENPAPPEFQMLLTYDPSAKEYTGFLMSGPNRLPITGTWNERSRTMTFKGTYPDGGQLVSKHRFIDKNHAESSSTISNPEGKVVLELLQKQTRREK